ncbi:UNVERIFIED_ORG: GspE/PulE family protein [Shinella sp. XGS7]|nr:GspE/PulE family protein [Shinella sp. XGS7]
MTTESKNFRAALASARQQHQAGGGAVLDILLRTVGDRSALQAWLAEHAGVQVIEAKGPWQPDFERWPLAKARQHRCVLLHVIEGKRILACEDPWNLSLLQRVNNGLVPAAAPVAVRREDLDQWLGDESTTPSGMEGKQSAALRAEGPIVQFVDQALQAGFNGGASDVHFECDREGVTVKHRLDGVMVQFARMSGAQSAQEVISRIKVLALLDITERRLPQDGRFRLELGRGDAASIDLRVSIMPSVHGEDAVLRLLDKAQLRGQEESVSLAHLGFGSADAQVLRDLAEMPSGLLLVTGPTGSGKTTTVYAMLSEINSGREKIITIEDPVEYELTGVLQIPVNERKGLTFAKGLRSILRHDPDRILVGEIRDAETAEIAVQSALTGHLVFTTVHANSVADVVGRFRHFGLDMFGFVSSLNGVVVQRLLRRLCPHCMTWSEPSAQDAVRLDKLRHYGSLDRLPQPGGCPECHGTGYKGRFVIAELHQVDDELRDLITEQAPLSSIKAVAQRRGLVSLLEQSLHHIRTGSTSLDEVRRIVGGV